MKATDLALFNVILLNLLEQKTFEQYQPVINIIGNY